MLTLSFIHFSHYITSSLLATVNPIRCNRMTTDKSGPIRHPLSFSLQHFELAKLHWHTSRVTPLFSAEKCIFYVLLRWNWDVSDKWSDTFLRLHLTKLRKTAFFITLNELQNLLNFIILKSFKLRYNLLNKQ